MRAKAKAILAKSILNASSKLKDIAGRLEKVLSSVSSVSFFTLYLNFLGLIRPFLLIATPPLQEFSFTQNRSHIRWLETGQILDIMQRISGAFKSV